MPPGNPPCVPGRRLLQSRPPARELALRQQLATLVIQRRPPTRPADRAFRVLFRHLWPGWGQRPSHRSAGDGRPLAPQGFPHVLEWLSRRGRRQAALPCRVRVREKPSALKARPAGATMSGTHRSHELREIAPHVHRTHPSAHETDDVSRWFLFLSAQNLSHPLVCDQDRAPPREMAAERRTAGSVNPRVVRKDRRECGREGAAPRLRVHPRTGLAHARRCFRGPYPRYGTAIRRVGARARRRVCIRGEPGRSL